MVIAFEEKQRQTLEETGLSIIELKRIVYRVAHNLTDVVEYIYDVVKKVTDTFIECLSKVTEVISSLIDECRKMSVKECIKYMEPRERHAFVKYLSKCDNIAAVLRKKVIYHCRNNC